MENTVTTYFKTEKKILDYINFLATTTSTNISSWKIKEVFADKSRENKLINKPEEINKIFFETLQSYKNTPVSSSSKIKLPDSKLNKVFKEKQACEIKRIESKINEAKKNIKKYQTYILASENEIETAEKTKQKLSNSKLNVETLKNQIKQIKWYTDIAIRGMNLWLLTPNVKIGSRKSKITKDMGIFAVRICMATFDVKVFPHKNNVYSVYGNYHPYVYRDTGNVCWGNGSLLKDKHSKEFNILGLTELLAALLTNYSGNGYSNLSDLIYKKEKLDPSQVRNFPSFPDKG